MVKGSNSSSIKRLVPRNTLRRWKRLGLLAENLTQRISATSRNSSGGRNLQVCDSSQSGSSGTIGFSSDVQSTLPLSQLLTFNLASPAQPTSSLTLDSGNVVEIPTQNMSLSADVRPPEADGKDAWLNQELYRDSKITVGEAVNHTLEFFLKNSLTKKSLNDLLKLYSLLLPKPNNMPKTKYFLDKLLKTLMPHDADLIKRYRICEDCSYFVGEWLSTNSMKECKNCQESNVNGLFVQYDLKSLLKDAFETRNLALLVKKFRSEMNVDKLSDLSGGSEFRRILEFIPGLFDLLLMWNIDALSISNSSNGQVLTLQAQIMNIPPQHRRSFQFLLGVYYSSTKKIIANSFLTPFAEKMKDLFDFGLDWHDNVENVMRHSTVVAPLASVDAQARAPCQNIMQHNGEYGCSTCEHPGMTCAIGKGHNRTFPILDHDPPLRTSERMQAQAEEAVKGNYEHVKGVKGPSILSLIPFLSLVLSFVPDYMHAILLGVVRMLLSLYFDPCNHGKPFYVKPKYRREIDELLSKIQPPDFIPRAPRTLKDKKNWKASELRSFLLFYGPIVLKGRLNERYYNHFLLLSYATRLLLQTEIEKKDLDLADSLLYLFVADIPALFGLNKCSFNAHLLTHLTMFVKLWGPMWAWSAFSFEDGNRYFKKIIHGLNKVEREILNTMKIVNAHWILKHKLSLKLPNSTKENVTLGRKKLLDTDDGKICLSLVGNRIMNSISSRDKIYVFCRCKIRNEIYTSELYERQVKRDNYHIFWNDKKSYGMIKYFIIVNGILYAIVQEIVFDLSAQEISIDYGVHLSLSQYIKPFRKSFIIHAVNVNDIEGKVICVQKYLCMSPNFIEKKL